MEDEEWLEELFGVTLTAFPICMVFLVADFIASQISSDSAKQRSRFSTRNLSHHTLKTKVRDKSWWATLMLLFRGWMTYPIRFWITIYRGHHSRKDQSTPFFPWLYMVLTKGHRVRKFRQNSIQEISQTALSTLCTKPRSSLTVQATKSLSRKF